MKTMKRIFAIIVKGYPIQCVLVIIGIVVGVLANVYGSLFLQSLIDDYITPLVGSSVPDFTPLLKALATMAVIYLVGVVSNYMYNRLMIYISEGSLKKVRDGLFDHMETLAIPYFDTHTHGDLMSIYTNDTDTLRQMISQSIPQLLSSAITIVSVFASMVYLSPILTLMIIAMVFVMTNVIKKTAASPAGTSWRSSRTW